MFKPLKTYEIFIILCVWFSAGVSLMAESLNSVALYFVLPTAFLVTIWQKWYTKTSKYLGLLIALYLWILFSVLWATDIGYAMRQVKQILGAFIFCWVIAKTCQNSKCIPWFYCTYIIILIGDWYYAYNNIFSVIDVGVDRLNDDKLNANTFAYHTFYVTTLLYILGEITTGKPRKILRILFLFTIPLSWGTAMLTGSRQVLLLQMPLIAIFLYIRYIKRASLSRKTLFIFVSLIILAISFRPVLDRYEDSTLGHRMEKNIEDDSRIKLAKDAFKVALEHFPFGVGANNYIVYSYSRHFSHNVYLELFANEGIIGLGLYLWLMGLFLKRQIARYKQYKDPLFLIFALFGIFYIIDGIFYSFYQFLWLIGFFMLVATHSEVYYRDKYSFIESSHQ